VIVRIYFSYLKSCIMLSWDLHSKKYVIYTFRVRSLNSNIEVVEYKNVYFDFGKVYRLILQGPTGKKLKTIHLYLITIYVHCKKVLWSVKCVGVCTFGNTWAV
jgi:hypothetical protein